MGLFHILDRVDSTNNYAMAAIHAGLASNGTAWFARAQIAGKGQRGKAWITNPGENITMSVAIEPAAFFSINSFVFNMAVSNVCQAFLSSLINKEIKVKWPNDLYIRDRKAGGILIENNYRGSFWKWAVAGIGINVNQVDFPGELAKATSLKRITGEDYNTIELGKALQERLVAAFKDMSASSVQEITATYNKHLYLRGEKVKLRKQNIVFETTIKGVNVNGQLLTDDCIPGQFEFGEIEWIL